MNPVMLPFLLLAPLHFLSIMSSTPPLLPFASYPICPCYCPWDKASKVTHALLQLWTVATVVAVGSVRGSPPVFPASLGASTEWTNSPTVTVLYWACLQWLWSPSPTLPNHFTGSEGLRGKGFQNPYIDPCSIGCCIHTCLFIIPWPMRLLELSGEPWNWDTAALSPSFTIRLQIAQQWHDWDWRNVMPCCQHHASCHAMYDNAMFGMGHNISLIPVASLF